MQRYDIYFSWRHLSAIKVENAIENVRFLSFSPLNITARCAIAFFLVSVLINSQGAVVVAMLPLAYSLGIDAW